MSKKELKIKINANVVDAQKNIDAVKANLINMLRNQEAVS